MAVCGYCGVEADVTITSDRKHSYTYPELQCRHLQEQAANKPEGAASGLADGLKASDTNEQTRSAIRDLLLSVTVTPAPAGQPPAISVQGKLEALIGLPGVVVAGTGVEPATYGL